MLMKKWKFTFKINSYMHFDEKVEIMWNFSEKTKTTL